MEVNSAPFKGKATARPKAKQEKKKKKQESSSSDSDSEEEEGMDVAKIGKKTAQKVGRKRGEGERE